MIDVTVKPSGILCRKTARKMIQPSQLETRKPEAIAIPSKKVWIMSPMSTDKLFRLLSNSCGCVSSPKVEVRANGVLEEVNDQVADKYQQRSGVSAQLKAGRNHFDDRRGQHEARSQGDKIAR